jgi:hypothetical protein
MSEPVFWGEVTVQNDKKQPKVDGFFFGSGVGLTNYSGPDATAVSFWKPDDKNWDKNLRIGDLVDLSATGAFGLPPDSHSPLHPVWTQWSLLVEPFVAQVGLNVTHFIVQGAVVGPQGFHYEPDDVGYHYGYFGWGAASITFEQEKNKKLSWAQLDYTLVNTYREQGHDLPISEYPYSVLGASPPVPTILNPEPSTIILMLGGLGLLLLRKFGSPFAALAVASVRKT